VEQADEAYTTVKHPDCRVLVTIAHVWALSIRLASASHAGVLARPQRRSFEDYCSACADRAGQVARRV